MKKKCWIYDLECYPTIFTFCAVYQNGKGMRVFEISDRKNEVEQMLEFLRKVKLEGHYLVGFNCCSYDYPLLHFILEKARKAFAKNEKLNITIKEIYKYNLSLFEQMKNSQFGTQIRTDDVIIPQIDLFLIHHFNNKARSTSLKMLEYNMRSANIEDLPFPPGTKLNDEQKDVLIKYNKHDVSETLKFFNYSIEAIELREELEELYGFDCTNFNDTKIGKQLLIDSIEKESPGSCYTYTERGRKLRQTKRDKIYVKNCIFPYIKFERPEFQAIQEWFKKQVITETKGVFSDVEEHDLGSVAQYAQMVIKRKKFKGKPSEEEYSSFLKEHPLGWIEEEELKATEYLFDENGDHVLEYPRDEFGLIIEGKKPKKVRVPKKSYWGCWNISETLNVVINGFRFDYGMGGIHGAKKGVICAKEHQILRSLDVASYYPNMTISNNAHPEHLGNTFCKVAKDLYDQRKSHKKGTPANSALKLALNGSWGDSGNEFSPLYDPQYTMTITISGQLSLCMLMEQLINKCNAEIVMCNTDGFEYVIDKQFLDLADSLVKEWETTTGLQMEGLTYEKMFISSVNHYISVDTEGKVKLKGAFEHTHFTKHGWHKNHSAMVIAKAVEAYFVRGEDYEEFIRLHEDKFDFCLRTKVPRNSNLVLSTENGDEPLQNICRYYPVKVGGGKLVKLMPPLEGDTEIRRLGIDTDWDVKSCNNIADFSWTDLNYDYYINEARKLIDSVVE